MPKKIIITGGCGFVGSNLAIGLKTLHPEYTIVAIDNLRRRGSELNIKRLAEFSIDFIHGDIRNREDLETIESADFVIDASADPSVLSGINSPILPLINTNLNGTVNCLELAHRLGAAFIFLSTSRVYPVQLLEQAKFKESETRFEWTNEQLLPGISSNGITEDFPLHGSRSYYGTTKLASELLIEEYHSLRGMQTVINRFGVISGPWQMGKIDQGVLVLWLARHYFKGSLKYIGYGGSGKQTRDVLHIADLVNLLDWQITNIGKVNGEIFNAGGGRNCSFSLLELTELCKEVTGNSIDILPETEPRPADVRIYLTDNAKVNAATLWEPTKTLKDIVSDTFQWLQSNETVLKEILK